MLRVGVVLDDLRAPAWVARVLASIRASDVAALTCVACAGAAPRPSRSLARRLVETVFAVADARLRVADPLAIEDVSPLLANVPRVEIRELAARDLDVLVSLGSREMRELDGVARHGTWRYVADDELWEVISRQRVSRVALVTSSGDVLVESWSGTDPYSLRRHRAQRYWKAASFVARALRDLQLQIAPTKADVPVAPSARAIDTPHRPSAMLRGPAEPDLAIATTFVAFGGVVAQERLAKLVRRDQWLLGYTIDAPHRPSGLAIDTPHRPSAMLRGPAQPGLAITGAGPSTLPATWTGDAPSLGLDHLRMIVPPRERFWADPFVAPDGRGGWVIFFEDKRYGRPASLSALVVDRDGAAGPAFPILETPYHLSYPFVFRWQDTWWLMPETSRNKCVAVWRATDYPRAWQREHVLMADIEAVDPTLFEHEGRWWMFCNIGERGATREDELHLFHAASPLGPWTAHRMNPIKSNIRGARPAGHVFRDERGALHRPAQDGSGGYGSQIILHRIAELDVAHYREIEIARIAPDRAAGFVGLHTINAAAGLTVIDTCLPRPKLGFRGRSFEREVGRAVVEAD